MTEPLKYTKDSRTFSDRIVDTIVGESFELIPVHVTYLWYRTGWTREIDYIEVFAVDIFKVQAVPSNVEQLKDLLLERHPGSIFGDNLEIKYR